LETPIILQADSSALDRAAQLIRAGGVVAFPTETVYGLGADARNPTAVARIFELKRRPSIDPVIVHVADPSQAEEYGVFSNPVAYRLIERFWPGPLTLVVEKKPAAPAIVTAGLPTVGIRMPAHPVALELIRRSRTAIAAPSANPFGYVSPTRAAHVAENLAGVDLILDAGPAAVGIESTIVSLVGERPCVLRAGGVTIEALEAVIGEVERMRETPSLPQAPGQLTRHYSTSTPLQIWAPGLPAPLPGERWGLLTLNPVHAAGEYAAVEVLSAKGDIREAAANLFDALHRLDRMNLDRIIAISLPEQGLGIAIMDRLRRCAH
jgi:L-threonylcarbamoyladenylate synthase